MQEIYWNGPLELSSTAQGKGEGHLYILVDPAWAAGCLWRGALTLGEAVSSGRWRFLEWDSFVSHQQASLCVLNPKEGPEWHTLGRCPLHFFIKIPWGPIWTMGFLHTFDSLVVSNSVFLGDKRNRHILVWDEQSAFLQFKNYSLWKRNPSITSVQRQAPFPFSAHFHKRRPLMVWLED